MMCRFPRSLSRLALGAWLVGASLTLGSAAVAQVAANSPGTWTIAVVTSGADPASKVLLQRLRANPWVVANSDRVRVSEVNSDGSGRPSTGGSTAVLVYQQGLRGLEMMGGRSGFAGAEDVVLWVRGVVAGSTSSTIRDPNLAQANLDGRSLSSGQAETPTYPTSPMQTGPYPASSYPQTYMPQPQGPMTYALPMPATMVQAPQQQVMIHQPQPQVYFTNPMPPMGYLPQLVAPGPNLFMNTAPMIAGPQQMMTTPQPMGVAPQAMAAVAPQPTGVPVGPGLAGASLTTSSFSVPASSTTSRVRVRGPGPVASALSRFGERLTTLGRTRIESIQETRLETQTAQTPPGQFMTLSSTSASPVLTPSQPQNYAIPTPQPPTIPCPPAGSPQGPQASPQSGSGRSR